MNIQWYPGHMAKTKRLIKENSKLIDVVIEILDSRLPKSSTNPDLDSLLSLKPKLILLNKSDLADPIINKLWEEYYNKKNITTLSINSLTGKNCDKIPLAVKNLIADKIEKDKKRGITRQVRVMVVGIPNVGKSSLINRLTGRASAKTGDRPGVTKGKQWLRIDGGIELLDTPGILWPKFDDENIGQRLAFVGSIKDEIIDIETLACHLLDYLKIFYSDLLKQRYKLEGEIKEITGFELLEYISKKRGFIIKGGEFDTYRGASIILDEFRSAKIGRVSLERP